MLWCVRSLSYAVSSSPLLAVIYGSGNMVQMWKMCVFPLVACEMLWQTQAWLHVV